GGGVVPDLIVHEDSATAGEEALLKALGTRLGDFRDAVTATALRIRDAKSVTDEHFAVTPAMRAEVLGRLRSRGVKVSGAVWAGGTALVDQWIGGDVARYVFGRGAELRRRAAADPQMQRALALLRGARGPKDLFTAAAR
ncbi:MAG TPA: hypothetical protein VLC11_02450, partial [Gemmatimonadales bacterium]|nr:hypothetical protein [Gemmatimonadales bacterium]